MTGVGQLPRADTPAPVPRLTSPDAHMSPSLSLSLWELQPGCLGRFQPRAYLQGGKGQARPRKRTFAKKHKGHTAGHPSWPRTSPRPPISQIQAHSCLWEAVCSLVQGQRGESSVTHIPATLPAPALGSSLMEPQDGGRWLSKWTFQIALVLCMHGGHCAPIPWTPFYMPDWNFHTWGHILQACTWGCSVPPEV